MIEAIMGGMFFTVAIMYMDHPGKMAALIAGGIISVIIGAARLHGKEKRH